jgi:UDP:flavonoid glycosyltransferase YjiC (YdhE family)
MNILLATYGSRGDVQPLLALCVALESAGHQVAFAAPPERRAWIEAHGCTCLPLGRDVSAFLDRLPDAHSPASAIRFLFFLRKELAEQFDLLDEMARHADLALGSSLAFALASVAERRDIPYRFIAFTPQLLPSSSHPAPLFRIQGLPGWWNRMTWGAMRIADRFNITRLINRRRLEWGLPPIRDAWTHVLGPRVIVASDPEVAPVPRCSDIPSVQTGYFHLEQPAVEAAGLERFLETGAPVVYAGFGSMPQQDQHGNVPLMVRAARSAGCRLIVGKFWEGVSPYENASDVYYLKGYPHLKLFPRMAAVVHHGGAGTTATCAASGVPQVIVPHILDQHYWAHRVWRAGLGPRPIRRTALEEHQLAETLRLSISDPAMREQAAETARRIDRRESLLRAVREIESACADRPPATCR